MSGGAAGGSADAVSNWDPLELESPNSTIISNSMVSSSEVQSAPTAEVPGQCAFE